MNISMVIEQTTDLGKEALQYPLKYNAFMGISILQKFFSKNTMRHYFEWLSKQFTQSLIILMDDPNKYNFIIFKGLSPQEALIKSRQISDKLKSGYEKIIRNAEIHNIKVVQFRDFEHQEKYQQILTGLKYYMKINKDLDQDLLNLMETGIGGKITDYVTAQNITNALEITRMKNVLYQYSVEEVASIIYFSEIGYPIEIDPTIEFSTKTLIYQKKFPELYKKLDLHTRGHIYIHPEGITKDRY